MTTLAESVRDYVARRRLLKAGDRVGVAVSGGADSVALLRVLLELRTELGVVLSVVHFNHNLRGAESDEDENFVARLGQRQELQLYCGRGDVAPYASFMRLSLEAGARALRYRYFGQLLQERLLDRVATGHTLDDQAETVLLRLVRGAGTRGMAGIYPRLPEPSSRFPVPGSRFSDGYRLSASGSEERGCVVRPMLGVRRGELQSFLNALGQEWREDTSNTDLRFARNRVRHGILPQLERDLNPAVREALADTAEIARGEEEFWEKEVASALPLMVQAGRRDSVELRIPVLLSLSLALQRRVARTAAEALGLRLQFRQVEEVLAVAAGIGSSVELPGGRVVCRQRDVLSFQPAVRKKAENYEYRLPVPGGVEVSELGTRIEAILVPAAEEGYNPENLVDAALLPAELRVRNWRAGDRFWPAHSKGPKKIKELLQDRHIRGTERKLWPVIAGPNEIVWVRGFPLRKGLRANPGAGETIVIREIDSA